jgi:hypothetical protein
MLNAGAGIFRGLTGKRRTRSRRTLLCGDGERARINGGGKGEIGRHKAPPHYSRGRCAFVITNAQRFLSFWVLPGEFAKNFFGKPNFTLPGRLAFVMTKAQSASYERTVFSVGESKVLAV